LLGINLAFARLILLSDEEVTRIHEASLKILQKIGIKVLSKKVQSLLAENGAEVDATRSIVKIPNSLVQEAIEKAPKKMVLCGRNSKFDLKLPSTDIPFIATSGYSSFMRDFKTGEKRMTKNCHHPFKQSRAWPSHLSTQRSMSSMKPLTRNKQNGKLS